MLKLQKDVRGSSEKIQEHFDSKLVFIWGYSTVKTSTKYTTQRVLSF